jgi:hypothetical protein
LTHGWYYIIFTWAKKGSNVLFRNIRHVKVWITRRKK